MGFFRKHLCGYMKAHLSQRIPRIRLSAGSHGLGLDSSQLRHTEARTLSYRDHIKPNIPRKITRNAIDNITVVTRFINTKARFIRRRHHNH